MRPFHQFICKFARPVEEGETGYGNIKWTCQMEPMKIQGVHVPQANRAYSIHNLGMVGHIEDIAVAKDQQGKKLGLRIIQALDYVAEQVGCYKVCSHFHTC